MSVNSKTMIESFNPDLAIEDSPTPPASWYTSQELLELEKKSAFTEGWQVLGNLEQLKKPGDFIEGCFLSKPYLIYCDANHKLRGFHNVCPHHGGWLQPVLNQPEELQCSYHGWRFDSSGKLLKAPHAGGSNLLKNSKLNLKPLQVQTWGPLVLVCFSDSAPFFEGELHEEKLGSLKLDNLKHIKTVSYPLKCNWKVFVDNYLDGGYHVKVLHQNLAQNLDLDSYENHIFERSSVQSCKADGQKQRIGKSAYYGWFYPNTMINRYGQWLDLNRVIPTSETTCDVIFEYFYDGDKDLEDLKQELKDSDQVQQEDILICERVQKSMESGLFDQGFYAPKLEEPMYHFHALLYAGFRQALGINSVTKR